MPCISIDTRHAGKAVLLQWKRRIDGSCPFLARSYRVGSGSGVPARCRRLWLCTPVRVVVVGPGGAGKSTFARQLAAATGAQWIEIDKMFWQAGLTPLAAEEWEALQEETFGGDGWIADGDLGPFDALSARLRLADTVAMLDVPLWRCVWRSLRRSRERLDYWRWLLSWRRRYRPRLLEAVAACPDVELLVVRTPADQQEVIGALAASV